MPAYQLVRDRGGGREAVTTVAQPLATVARQLTYGLDGRINPDWLFAVLANTHGARRWESSAEADCDLLATVHFRLGPDGWSLHRPGRAPVPAADLLADPRPNSKKGR